MKQCIPTNYTFKLHPGFVVQNDGTSNFLASSTLAKLYGLNWHECAIQMSSDSTAGWVGETLHLHPLPTGNYKEYLQKMIHEKENDED